jgi:hypothetical protein
VKNLFVALFVVCALGLACSDKSATTPTPSPTPAAGPALSGFVRDRATNAPLENARVEVVDAPTGSLTGLFVLTDASGRYNFSISGTQSFRASKEGYEGESRRLTVSQTSTADFGLVPLSSKPPRETILPGETKTGTVGFGDPTCNGLFFIRPCKRFILLVSEGATLKVRLTWQGTSDIDLELWLNDTLFDKSLTCQACGIGTSEEEFTRFVPAGEYELRAVIFDGAGGPFTMTVTRIN